MKIITQEIASPKVILQRLIQTGIIIKIMKVAKMILTIFIILPVLRMTSHTPLHQILKCLKDYLILGTHAICDILFLHVIFIKKIGIQYYKPYSLQLTLWDIF